MSIRLRVAALVLCAGAAFAQSRDEAPAADRVAALKAAADALQARDATGIAAGEIRTLRTWLSEIDALLRSEGAQVRLERALTRGRAQLELAEVVLGRAEAEKAARAAEAAAVAAEAAAQAARAEAVHLEQQLKASP